MSKDSYSRFFEILVDSLQTLPLVGLGVESLVPAGLELNRGLLRSLFQYIGAVLGELTLLWHVLCCRDEGK